MFDPSFFELIIICVVALLVLGPDRLPGAIKTLGLWIGRLRRSFNNIKREIEQEVGADEIRRQLRNEAIMEKFNNTKSQVTESIESIKSETDSIKDDLNLKKELSGFGNITEENKASDSPDPGKMLASDETNTTPPEQKPASSTKDSSPEPSSDNAKVESNKS